MLQKIINSCLLTCALIFCSFYSEPSFKAAQLKNSRVKAAYQAKWPALQALLKSKNIKADGFDLYLRSFKQEGELEAWAKNKSDKAYTFLKNFAICASSGSLGPKRKQGDGQVPEGFYQITSFNPNSSYHLSLKVNYPNKSDALKASGDVGGDIMIHGECVTIGCIPIQNGPIEELYVLAVESKNGNGSINVNIYPYHFSKQAANFAKAYSAELQSFWAGLKKADDCFEKNHCLPVVNTDKSGNYIVEPCTL